MAEAATPPATAAVPEAQTPAPVAQPPAEHHEVPPQGGAAPQPAPAHTGGMFRLGAHDHEPARNLDYLLEDDEEESGSSRLWIGLVLLAVVVGGLGYWHYRDGGWNSAARGNSTVAAPSATADDNAASKPSETTPAAGSPPANAAAAPAKDDSAVTDVHPTNPVAAPSVVAAPADAAPKANTPEANPSAATSKPAPEKPVTKAHTVVRPEPAAKAEDPVAAGEKYIYGRGVPQNCERGLKLVKPAADQANHKAMITMGALYATGHCVPRDLPTAYRFFALALRKEPENAALRENTESIWSKMTPSERQQAIRLTQ